MLLSDRPIECSGEDQLGFQPFASALAKGLREMAPTEGFVVAIHAPWGSGKTSALNLIERHLAVLDIAELTNKSVIEFAELAAVSPKNATTGETSRATYWANAVKQHRGNFRTTVVRFNPWYFSGQESLFKAFFGIVGTELDIANETAIAKAFASILRRGAEAGGAIGAGVGMAAGGPPGATGGAAIGGLFGRVLGDTFDRTEGLEALLQKLKDALQASKRRVLVIIDDVDRLLPDELRQMLTLIKSLGNLPNVTYLLAFDQEQVARLLEKAGIRNADYMSKIVQTSFQLPRADRSALQGMLFARMDAIRKSKPIDDPDRWAETFIMHIDAYLKTPRDVTRLGNALQVIWPSVEGEVDWSDLVLLEVLRLHEPRHYALILDYLDMLTGATFAPLVNKTWAKTLLPMKSNCADPDRLKGALIKLFPRLAKEWNESSSDWTNDIAARRDRRLRCEEYARNYFALAPSSDQFMAAEIKALLSSQTADADYAALFEKAKARMTLKKLTMVCRLLEQISEELTPKNRLSTELARAILKRSSETSRIGDKENYLVMIDNDQRMRWLFISALRCWSEDERVKQIESWSSGTDGVAFLVPFIESVTGDDARGDPIVPLSGFVGLRALALELIGNALSEPDFPTRISALLLFSWARLSSYDTVTGWLKANLDQPEILVALARCIPSEGQSSAEGPYLFVDRAAWSKLTDVDDIAKRVALVRTPENAEILDRFALAATRRSLSHRSE